MWKVGGEVEDGIGEGKKWKVSVESGVMGMESNGEWKASVKRHVEGGCGEGREVEGEWRVVMWCGEVSQV